MLNVGLGEFIVFCILAILILGPEKLPQALQSACRMYKKVKYVFDANIYDLEAQLEKHTAPHNTIIVPYHYTETLTHSPYSIGFIQRTVKSAQQHPCSIAIIHQLHNFAFRQELIQTKHSTLPNLVSLKEVA